MGLHIYSDKDVQDKLKAKLQLLIDDWNVEITDGEVVVGDNNECTLAYFDNVEDFDAGVQFVLDLIDNGWTDLNN